LLFAALAIDQEAIGAKPHLAGQGLHVLFALASVFVVSLLVAIPEQSSAALGAELITGALLSLVIAVPRQLANSWSLTLLGAGPADDS
jgi:hypothetical protein